MESSWRPKIWVVIVLGILLQPFVFLYTNRIRVFFAYIPIVLAVGIVDWYLQTFFSLIFIIVFPLHAYFQAKNYVTSRIRAWYSRWWGIPSILGAFFTLVFFVRSFLYEPFYIPAASMSPTLNVGDFVIVKKLGFGTYGTYGITVLNTDISDISKLERGKVYVFYPPHQNSPFVKRLIAIPGDSLEIVKGQVILNGKELPRDFLQEDNSKKIYQEKLGDETYLTQHLNHRSSGVITKISVPEGSYFFMGDNRDNSSDSRMWGGVPSSRIVGEVVLSINH
jgi:signal peptidase I